MDEIKKPEEYISKEEVRSIITNKMQELGEEFERYSRDNDSFYFEHQGYYHLVDEVLRSLLSEID